MHRGTDGWYVVCRDAERNDAGRRGPPATTTEVEDPLYTIAVRPGAGRPFAGLQTDGGDEWLFDVVRENLTARPFDAARRCTEVVRAEESATAGGDDRAAGPDPLRPGAGDCRWLGAGSGAPGLRRVVGGEQGVWIVQAAPVVADP